MALLFSRSASPHHGFAAYYTYLESIFKVDVHPFNAAPVMLCPCRDIAMLSALLWSVCNLACIADKMQLKQHGSHTRL